MALARHKATPDGYVIHVSHGTVIYLAGDRIGPFIAGRPELRKAEFLPFVKQIEYAEQQEYRFVISVQFHAPKKDTFDLGVSAELRNLMTPLGYT